MLFDPISRRQFLLKFGMNAKAFNTLVSDGVVVVKVEPGIRHLTTVVSHSMQEGTHYLVCRSCSSFQAMVSPKHLKSCCGLTVEEYQKKYPDAPLMCSRTKDRKVKTPEQRKAQADKLNANYASDRGPDIINRIRASTLTPERQQQSRDSLARLRSSPDWPSKMSAAHRKRWSNPENKRLRALYVEQHREELRSSIAHARSFNKTTSKLHLQFKDAMLAFGLDGFESEFSAGYYVIDEAHPTKKIAVEVDGCYWHGCPSCGLTSPKTTQTRDKRKTTYLTNRGWIVLRFKECAIKADLLACLKAVEACLKNEVSSVN